MLERLAHGEIPAKHHTLLRGKDGSLRHEECLTRQGFDGPYTILYHERRPQALQASSLSGVACAPAPEGSPPSPLKRRHFHASRVPLAASVLGGRVPLLYNADLTLSVLRPTQSDAAYFINGDADELYFVRSGSGVVRSVLGDLPFSALDYVFLPKGVLHRFELAAGAPHEFLSMQCHRGVDLPQQWRNRSGQLRLDAPYCHRDFRRPTFRGPLDEGLRDLMIQRNGAHHRFQLSHSPLDVVGWDGSVYPWAFPILAFQPRVSSVHLPPTWHGTFAAGGALICSFVPRPLDFHPCAIPCPYPHSSVDVDEVLYYVSGEFTSREGVGPGSITLHPRGIPHGPQPGRYEASIGATSTQEVAVMLDCSSPLCATSSATMLEAPAYEASFLD